MIEDVRCVTCGARPSPPKYTKFGLHIVGCSSCGLHFVSPRHSKEVVWARYSAQYFSREYLPAQRALFVRVANSYRCTCGCGFTLATCRAYDAQCPVSGPRVRALRDSVRAGLVSARGLRQRPKHVEPVHPGT